MGLFIEQKSMSARGFSLLENPIDAVHTFFHWPREKKSFYASPFDPLSSNPPRFYCCLLSSFLSDILLLCFPLFLLISLITSRVSSSFSFIRPFVASYLTFSCVHFIFVFHLLLIFSPLPHSFSFLCESQERFRQKHDLALFTPSILLFFITFLLISLR